MMFSELFIVLLISEFGDNCNYCMLTTVLIRGEDMFDSRVT